MINKPLTVTVLVLAGAAASVGSAQADWRNDAAMAASMAGVASHTAAALAGGGYSSGYGYRPRPTYYRMLPVTDCCYERIQWRRVPAYAPY
ncbi:hypothetical protein [Methylobacterium sp. WL7]|uniref:hypothetical protein n=1 Tax=Methylobacterium sp. WL7 TaxID=2603900 RepID=UPI0011CB3DE5|nr:hypothetical protein [Methylobacterium sp. WL7]TXN42933.1 hypothetical protein FV233_20575 [Methylobacterium sp. WL7]